MQPRMKNPVMIFPEALQALYALSAAAKKSDLPRRTAGPGTWDYGRAISKIHGGRSGSLLRTSASKSNIH